MWTTEEMKEAREVFGKITTKKKDYYNEDNAGMPDMSIFELSCKEALYVIKICHLLTN